MPDFPINREFVVELARSLVRFPSVNPPGNEEEAARFLAQSLENLGLDVELQNIGEDRANVVARIKGRGPGHLVLSGHLDVVPPGEQIWKHPPFEARLENGRIYGRGSADMKGGVASIAGALATLHKGSFRPRADVILAATAGEEAGMLGAGILVERRTLDGAAYLLVAEPSDLGVFIAQKGVLWLRIKAYGRTAHGSMPALGVNAVSFMTRFVSKLEDHEFPHTQSPLLGAPTLSVNEIHGGNKTNVVPDRCEVAIDMRTVPSQDQKQVVSEVRAVAESMARDFHSDLRVEIEIENDKMAVETDPGEPFVEAVIQSVSVVRGRRPEPGGVPYGTDAAELAPGFGVPMVICGPGEPGMAHQPDESVDIDQLVQAAEIYADLAVRLLA